MGMVSSAQPDIPFSRLNISPKTQERLTAGKRERFALASGKVPLLPEESLGVGYVLSNDADPRIARAARRTLIRFPVDRLVGIIDRNTHPKILEFLVEFREDTDNQLLEIVYRQPDMNDRTARMVTRKADSQLCEIIADNHTRLLMTPEVLIDLHGNENCPDVAFTRAESFLRMQGTLPELPTARAPKSDAAEALTPEEPTLNPLAELDLEAEIAAALSGDLSPALSGASSAAALEMFDLDEFADERDEDLDTEEDSLGVFRFDFRDGTEDFAEFLIRENSGEEEEENPATIEQMIREMTTGRRIKLAYKGNKSVRTILLRDTNKLVAVAVVKSGRMTEGEIADAAANRNLAEEVIREIARTREFTRRYPVKLALVNNAKTPVAIAISMLPWLNKRDLRNLSRSRGVSNAVTTAALNLFKRKYQRS